VQTLEGHEGTVTAVTTLSNSDVVSSSTDETVRIWDSTTGQCKHIVQFPASVIALAALPNGDIVCVSEEQPLVMIDKFGNQLRVFDRLSTMDILCVGVLPNGDIVSGSADNTIRIWDSKTGECKEQFTGHQAAVTTVLPLPNGDILSASKDGKVHLWGELRGAPKKEFGAKAAVSVNCLAANLSGDIVVGNAEGIVAVWAQ